MKRMVVAAWLAGWASAQASAQMMETGRVLERVEVPGHPGQSYALYVPSGYTPDRAWPVLFCLDPGARGRAPVQRFRAAAEKAGVIVAGSNNSRNGPLAPSEEAIRLMVEDVNARLNLDGTKVFAAGLSGGSRLALAWAISSPIAGVIANSAGFGVEPAPKRIPFRSFLTAGFDDFNHDEMYRLSREMAKRGVPHRYVEFEGGHEWLPEALTEEALAYLLGKLPDKAAEASKEMERQAVEFQRRFEQVQTAEDGQRAGVVKQLQTDAARTADSPERRVARRVIGSISVGSGEMLRSAMAQKQYGEAVRYAETAVLLRPENVNAWYSLALARAASGNVKRAIEALQEAAKRGFRTWERVDAEPLFAQMRRDKRYQSLKGQ